MISDSTVFDNAMIIAIETHRGVVDKGGKPYILHPLRVAMRLRTDDLIRMAIAVLHDVVEDGDITLAELEDDWKMPIRVIDALRLLTHEPGVPYRDYINAMRENLDALLVKREDLRDNSDITRLRGVTEKDIRRLEKYAVAYRAIQLFIKELENEPDKTAQAMPSSS